MMVIMVTDWCYDTAMVVKMMVIMVITDKHTSMRMFDINLGSPFTTCDITTSFHFSDITAIADQDFPCIQTF